MQFINHRPWFSYRGLPPHQFMPMLGVHNHIKFALYGRRTSLSLGRLCGRYAVSYGA
jgi:hypothetical protein